jgi:hypothetical protein
MRATSCRLPEASACFSEQKSLQTFQEVIKAAVAAVLAALLSEDIASQFRGRT